MYDLKYLRSQSVAQPSVLDAEMNVLIGETVYHWRQNSYDVSHRIDLRRFW